MAIVDPFKSLISFTSRGKYSNPNELGNFWLGVSELGHFDPKAGYYQKRRGVKGQIIVFCNHYFPADTPTEAKANYRAVFASGVSAWHSLDEESKNVYRRLKNPPRMSGFNRFMSKYISENYP